MSDSAAAAEEQPKVKVSRAEKEAAEAKAEAAVPRQSQHTAEERRAGRRRLQRLWRIHFTRCGCDAALSDRSQPTSLALCVVLARAVKPPPEPRVKGIHVILPYLLMGSADVAINKDELKYLGVKQIMNCASEGQCSVERHLQLCAAEHLLTAPVSFGRCFRCGQYVP